MVIAAGSECSASRRGHGRFGSSALSYLGGELCARNTALHCNIACGESETPTLMGIMRVRPPHCATGANATTTAVSSSVFALQPGS
jgi:hypothetical protein